MATPAPPLQRLYKTKFALLALVSMVAGVGLMLLAAWTPAPGWEWLNALPVNEIGLALFTTGLFGVLFQYTGQRDAQEHTLQQIRDVVVEGFQSGTLVGALAPEKLDQIVENALGSRFGDKGLAKDVYLDLREQVGRFNDRRRNAHVKIDLAPWKDGPEAGLGAMFVATVTWEYKLVPTTPLMRISCVSDLDTYRALQMDASCAEVWYFEEKAGLSAGSEDTFKLLHVAVDGKVRAARRTSRAGAQTYAVNLATEVEARQEVTVAYTYRVLVQKNSHLVSVDISRPTKGFKVQLNYGNCGIRYVNVLDHASSARQPRVSQLPATDPSPSAEVAFDGWLFPRAGVAFVWVLEGELPQVGRNDRTTTAGATHRRRA